MISNPAPPFVFSSPGVGSRMLVQEKYISSWMILIRMLMATEYESRSSYLDYLTIGTFKLTDNMSVISLRNTREISPFALESEIENYVIHQKYLGRLERELSKPVRRLDKELDYLPTQYLCEYVKSLGYDAIEYGSALHKGGINLAIFDDSKIECKSVDVYEVDSLVLHLEKVI
ncbi:RES family NAD+ phosphorylase [Arcticibacter tournemirensis]|uniref:RES domain-containing protein n=1 Tax=Arcticibacter tournemirensis TaxID=699437 RepID=A0A4Q0M4B0_9SPHI|nr:RES family NAD+ phosphorylase [Arcticibacter tournemirensis]RXF67725.1 RES domain-containing protein [Arcticibacter tournemirensis]